MNKLIRINSAKIGLIKLNKIVGIIFAIYTEMLKSINQTHCYVP